MKTVNDTIKINCETKDYLNFTELTEFQGDLKKREREDVDKIVKSIKQLGFSVPFFVWKHNDKNYVLDGHGRLLGLQRLDELGFFIPPLPVVYVNCKTERDARDLLLRINSHYGKMSAESVLDFIGDFDINLENFVLPDGAIKFDEDLPDLDLGDDPDEKTKEKQLGILVSCETESEMENTFMQLLKMGLNCKMVE